MQASKWSLHQGFITAQIQRLNHTEYFASNFACPDLDTIILTVNTAQQALKNRQQLNCFFDNLIASNDVTKCFFVRLKWIVYLHTLIQSFSKGSIMYGLVLKALQVYSDKFSVIKQNYQGYNKYLCKNLFKPYLQYLSKLCLLDIPNRSETLQSNDKENMNKMNCDSPLKSKRSPEKLLRWYRQYNFIIQTLESFSQILKDQQNFFKSQFPYFINIRKLMGKDLKMMIKNLKYGNMSLDDLNMTMIELDKLEYRICEFLKGDESIFEATESILMTGLQDCSKEDITNFMCTPLKPSTLQLNTE